MDSIKELESALADKFNLSNLDAGGHVIRNEKGWRENEIFIEDIWLVMFDKSFIGTGGIFSIKYRANPFREFSNPEKLVQGVFRTDNKKQIQDFYFETEFKNFTNVKNEFNNLDLFQANQGITLDGISYRIHLFSLNTDIVIWVNNPNHDSWKNWEKKISSIGKGLANKSNNTDLIKLFE